MIDEKHLESIVEARFSPGDLRGVGVMVGYYNGPVAIVRLTTGEEIAWAANFCNPIEVKGDAKGVLVDCIKGKS